MSTSTKKLWTAVEPTAESDEFRNVLARYYVKELQLNSVSQPISLDYFDTVFANHLDDLALQRVDDLYDLGSTFILEY